MVLAETEARAGRESGHTVSVEMSDMTHRAKCCLALTLVAGSLSLAPRLTVPKISAIEVVPGVRAEPFCWLGVSSCSAAACHGGGIKGARGSEWTTCAECDPHFKAHKVLLNDRSRRIIKNLNDPTPADCNPLCLACHGLNVKQAKAGHRVSLTDGIGCESCHGPAEKWVAKHYLPEWKHLSNEEKTSLGFRPNKDLVVRAQVCADCHVGKRDKEVNHDLIAAGHPRLNFEFGSYLSTYPKHWDERAEKLHCPDLEARAWEIGQLVSARTALELLAHRASSPDAPWPEFAESNCFACHKDLSATPPEPRRKDPRRLGSIPWSSWYYAMLEEGIEGENRPLSIPGKLRVEMEKRIPNRTIVAGLARTAAQELTPTLANLCRKQTESPRVIHNRLERLFLQERKGKDANWDQAAQRYLRLAALYHALGDLAPEMRDPLWKQELNSRAAGLAFPKGQDSPGRRD